jgi:hypothetical protein
MTHHQWKPVQSRLACLPSVPPEEASNMALFCSFDRLIEHVGPSENGTSSNQACCEGSAGMSPSSPKVVTKHLAQTEWIFCKHGPNCSPKIIRQGPAGSDTVKRICSPLLKVSPRPLHCRQSERCRARHQLKSSVDIFRFQPLKHKETDHCSLFCLVP